MAGRGIPTARVMAIWLYRVVFVPVLLLLAPALLWRNRKREGHWEAVAQRFGRMPGLPPKSPKRRRVWVQAVSVGELLAIGPVLRELAGWPEVEVVLTTTTSTGHRLAEEHYGDLVAMVGYFPLDLWPSVARAWRQLQPDLMVLTEGERWPEHLHAARVRGVPVVCVNARLSDRSFARMRWLRPLVPDLMGGFTRLLVVSAEDGRRFRTLGFAPAVIEETGNIKVDSVLTPLDTAALAALRRELGFGPTDPVLVGASTWPGEELSLVAAWRAARKRHPTLRLLLVPRHAERREDILAELAEAGLDDVHVRSTGPARAETVVCLADTTGELSRLLQIGSVVFVGKSLPPHLEGQTPVEAAGLGRAVLFGPGMANFRAIAGGLVEAGAACVVKDPAGLEAVVQTLLADDGRRERMAAAGIE